MFSAKPACFTAAVIAMTWGPSVALAAGPSFDCARASTPVETVICDSPELSELDLAMAEAFRARRDMLSGAERAANLAEQRRWLRSLAGRCPLRQGDADYSHRPQEIACLKAQFVVRIAQLRATVVAAGTAPSSGPPGASATVVPEFDDRAGAYDDPRLTVARIQSNLERIAVGRQAWPLPDGVTGDPLEAIVGAFARFLLGDWLRMDIELGQVHARAVDRVDAAVSNSERGRYVSPRDREAIDRYYGRLATAAEHDEPLVRLLVGLRRADSVLFAEAAGWVTVNREGRSSFSMAYAAPRVNDTWLRLPCRTLVGRTAAFEAAGRALGDLAGPLISCPAEGQDLASLEALAKAHWGWSPKTILEALDGTLSPVPAAAAERSPYDKAIDEMGERPASVEPVLREAARSDLIAKLNYVLYLHAFKLPSPARDAEIKELTDTIVALAKRESDPGSYAQEFVTYDGTDESLLVVVVAASEAVRAVSAFSVYEIPCAILVARPKLLAATAPVYGSTRDVFIPRSGCHWGRREIKEFPEESLRLFVTETKNADGDFIANFGGTMRYGFIASQNHTIEAMKVDPRSYLAAEEPAVEYPYQVWGMLNPLNYRISMRLKRAHEALADELVRYNVRLGLDRGDAVRAARKATFAAAWGANCGGGVPRHALRALLLSDAPVSGYAKRLANGGEKDPPEIVKCAEHAGLDPLLHVATVKPEALRILLDDGADADERNAIGKTPLMWAAQFDKVDSVRLLLKAGARVNAQTWQAVDHYELTLYHDARSPLMYAAANASLSTIKLLLAAGADPFQSDTKGMRAIHYLLGYGPTPANSTLSAAERAEAVRLLY